MHDPGEKNLRFFAWICPRIKSKGGGLHPSSLRSPRLFLVRIGESADAEIFFPGLFFWDAKKYPLWVGKYGRGRVCYLWPRV